MNYYDIHAHLADARILSDADRLVEECRSAGVKGILANAARVPEWHSINALCTKFDIIHGALGLHPFFLDQWHDGLIDDLDSNICANPKIIAIGEIGLDFYSGRDDQELQISVFSEQLLLAQKLNLPVILHNRKSWTEFFSVLKNLKLKMLKGVCHNFTGSKETARQLLDYGLYISFCGPITYPGARKIKQAAAYVPVEHILTETDTPDLPVFRQKGSYSSPCHIPDIIAELACIKQIAPEKLTKQVELNYHSLLSL